MMRWLKRRWRDVLRIPVNMRNKSRLQNDNFTIISSNCVGGVIYNSLSKQFLSPTINLWFEPNDFFRFVENLDKYLEMEIQEDVDHELLYPVGRLGDVRVYFMHYDNFDDAKRKWNDRKKRINKRNMYIVMTESPGFSETEY